MQLFRCSPQGVEMRGLGGKKEKQNKDALSKLGNRSSNMQGLPEQHIDGLLRCSLRGLQVEGLMHLLSSPVVDSCPQEYELPSTVSCACVWSEWAPPASVASESSQDRRQISTWQNHWPWSESKPNKDSTQSVAELRHQVERKWSRATTV